MVRTCLFGLGNAPASPQTTVLAPVNRELSGKIENGLGLLLSATNVPASGPLVDALSRTRWISIRHGRNPTMFYDLVFVY